MNKTDLKTKSKNFTIKKITKRHDIQALRGVAVLFIVLYHFSPELFLNGYLGVDIFFVISGFTISNLLYSKLAINDLNILEFFKQRIFRIFPSLISFIIFTQILAYLVLDHQFIYQNSLANLFSILSISNVYFANITNYFEQNSLQILNINLWSLSVQKQFYIVMPFLVLATKRLSFKRRNIIFIFLFSISILFFIPTLFFSFLPLSNLFLNFENYIFFSPFTRSAQFLLGVIAMNLNQHKIISNLKVNKFYLLLAISTFLFFNFSFFQNFQYGSVLVISFLTLIYLTSKNDIYSSNNLFFKPLLFVGNISFSLYLFHQPVLAAVRNHNYFGNYDLHSILHIQNGVFQTLLAIIILLISWFNYRFVEQKFRYSKFYFTKDNLVILCTLILAVLLVLSALFTGGYSFRDNDLKSFSNKSQLDFIVGTNYLKQNGDRCIDRLNLEEACIFNIESDNKIYLLGDSLVSALVSGFVENEKLKKFNIIEFTKGSCPVLINKCDFKPGNFRYDQIMNIKNSKIFLGGKYQEIDMSLYEEELLLTLEILALNNEVYLFSPFPNPGVNLRMYRLTNNSSPPDNYSEWSNQVRVSKQMFEKINIKNVYVINSEDIFCSQSKCEYFTNNYYFFNDYVHFSYFGASKVTTYLVEGLQIFD
tara:strand:+ start:11427 stop:13373 length:1947 start_codon:yes stop_codon:yes gene_type:complete